MDCCAFADRCDWATDACRADAPPLAQSAPGRLTACIRRTEIADEMRALRGAVLDAAAPLLAARTKHSADSARSRRW